MNMPRLLFPTLLLSLLLLGCQPAAEPWESLTLFPEARALPAISLQDSQGGERSLADLADGRWSLVFFGYAHCPDVCPATLAQINQLRRALQAPPHALPVADLPRSVFVSVDPERDDPDSLAGFLANFPSPQGLEPVLGLVAAPGPTRQLLASMGVSASTTDEQGLIDHTAAIFLIDPQGRYAGLMSQPLQPAQAVAELARLLSDGRG